MATRPKLPPQTTPLVDKDGRMTLDWYRFFSSLPSAGAFQTTVGAAGAASALPATPTGYKTETINGAQYVVPFYDPA